MKLVDLVRNAKLLVNLVRARRAGYQVAPIINANWKAPGRRLIVTITPAPDGAGYLAVALDTPTIAKEDLPAAERVVDLILGNHRHKNLGYFDSVGAAIKASESYANEWVFDQHLGKCTCVDIGIEAVQNRRVPLEQVHPFVPGEEELEDEDELEDEPEYLPEPEPADRVN